jgi:hypothetical protein
MHAFELESNSGMPNPGGLEGIEDSHLSGNKNRDMPSTELNKTSFQYIPRYIFSLYFYTGRIRYKGIRLEGQKCRCPGLTTC